MRTLIIGDVAECVMEPYRGPTGQVTTLNESIFTTIPGRKSPAEIIPPSYSSRSARERPLRRRGPPSARTTRSSIRTPPHPGR